MRTIGVDDRPTTRYEASIVVDVVKDNVASDVWYDGSTGHAYQHICKEYSVFDQVQNEKSHVLDGCQSPSITLGVLELEMSMLSTSVVD